MGSGKKLKFKRTKVTVELVSITSDCHRRFRGIGIDRNREHRRKAIRKLGKITNKVKRSGGCPALKPRRRSLQLGSPFADGKHINAASFCYGMHLEAETIGKKGLQHHSKLSGRPAPVERP